MVTSTKTRVNTLLEPEVAAELLAIGKRLGMSKTGITSLAVTFGLQAIKMAMDPDLKDYFEKQMKLGFGK